MTELKPIPLHPLELLNVAYHEAGHCLVARHFGRNIKRVLVRDDGTGIVFCQTINPTGRPDRARIAAEEIAIAAAGWIAENRFARSMRATQFTLDEAPYAVDLGNLHRLFDAGQLDRGLWPQLRRGTSRILESAWPSVIALADELAARRELSGTEVHQICRRGRTARVP